MTYDSWFNLFDSMYFVWHNLYRLVYLYFLFKSFRTPGFSSPQTVDTSTSGQPSSSHVQPSNFVQVPQNSFPTSQSNTTQKIAQITIQGGLIRQQIEVKIFYFSFLHLNVVAIFRTLDRQATTFSIL